MSETKIMRVLSLLSLGILLLACSSTEEKKGQLELHIQFSQYAKSVKDTFHIDIQLPESYFANPDKKYPVAVFVDGNFYFPIMSSIAKEYASIGLMKSMILVGIGYRSFQLMDSLRERDYLYPKALPSDEIISEGGGQRFYDFITMELLPKIDEEYRTQKENKALLGHSFGGYFVLYSLLNQLQNKRNDFKTFISASPSLWYNNFYLKQLPERLSKSESDLNIFVTVGGNEDQAWSIKPVTDLAAKIEAMKIQKTHLQSRVYNHLGHMDVPVLSFTIGLQECVK